MNECRLLSYDIYLHRKIVGMIIAQHGAFFISNTGATIALQIGAAAAPKKCDGRTTSVPTSKPGTAIFLNWGRGGTNLVQGMQYNLRTAVIL